MARYAHPELIVPTADLAARLGDPALRVFDCTTHLIYETGTGRPYRVESGRADYDRGHIPGSAYLDLQRELSDPDAPTNFMMLPPDLLAARFAARGIGPDSHVVLYARNTPQWATRVWWMLRAIGFDRAAVLDGGMAAWVAEGRPVATEETRYPPATGLRARPRPGLFVGRDAMRDAIGAPGICTINALSPELHRGEVVRYGRPGRIPGSVNLPAAALIDPATQRFRPAEEVAARFADIGADPGKRILLYCGGGIAATLDGFLLHQLGYRDLAVYDASMSEWAKDPGLPIEVG